uniref:Cilia and flagella associated protein 161 n=1 Tax=Tetraodon nigroviridis TaxID=99883 RepID=H3C4N8_TETNG
MDQNVKLFRTRVKIGNWNQERYLEEEEMNDYQEKRLRGELISQRVEFLKQNILSPVSLSATKDGRLHFGDVVILVNVGGENRERSALSINADIHSVSMNPAPSIQAPCGVSAGRVQACTRTAFIITRYQSLNPEGSALHFDQSFALKTASGFAGGLYLTSDLQTFQKCAQLSRLQEVSLDVDNSFLSWWKITHFDPQERLEHEGQPVSANEKVLIIHCKTNQALAALGHQVLRTTYGKEYEVTAHTFLDSHKAEQEENHWVMCTSDP